MNPWLEFRNDSGETIPPYACVRITGVEYLGSHGQRVVLTANRPDTYGSQFGHMLAGPTEVSAGRFGVCTETFPAWAAYLDSSAPQPGQSFGPKADSWTLHPFIGGFRIIGAPIEGRVLVVRAPLLQLRVRLNESLGADTTVEATVTYWDGSMWTDDAETLDVREAIGIENDIPADTICWCAYEANLDGFAVISAEC